MSEKDKDNNKFEFIKEQVIEKKRKKIQKRLKTLVKTVGLAVLFGLTASATFAIAEPKFKDVLNKEDETTKTPVYFPTQAPEPSDNEHKEEPPAMVTETPDPKVVIIEKEIEANLDDYMKMNNEVRKIANDALNSIVNITSTFSVSDLFGKTVVKTADTTGVIIYDNKKELLVLTSWDRIENADSMKIVLSESVIVNAVLQDYEEDINLAVIAVKIEDIPEGPMYNLKVANLGESYSATVGSTIIAVGSPNGHPKSMEIGMITSKGSYASITDNRLDLFNTDIEDNQYSDGIIVNLKGEVIGLITRTLKENENKYISTAIGISKLKPILTALGNKEARTYFGVKTDDMTNTAKKEYGIDNGIYVNDVKSYSPAYEASIQNGDIILSINDQLIISSSDFYDKINTYKPGDSVNVKIKRPEGTKVSELDFKVILKEKGH